MAARWPIVGLAALIVIALVSTLLLDVRVAVANLQGWAWELGGLALATYGMGYVIVTLLGVPATPLVAIAALLFGPVRALVIMATASMVSALLAFRIARSTARPALTDRLWATPAYARLCRLVERHGALVIPFVRLTPVLPFAAVNYGLGLTRIDFWRYALWSAVAILAGDALLVFGTDALYDVLTGTSLSWMAVAGTAAALAAVIALAMWSRRRGLAGKTDLFSTAQRSSPHGQEDLESRNLSSARRHARQWQGEGRQGDGGVQAQDAPILQRRQGPSPQAGRGDRSQRGAALRRQDP